jgi:acetyltransferase-like isoleucine patch superfamily enzyme
MFRNFIKILKFRRRFNAVFLPWACHLNVDDFRALKLGVQVKFGFFGEIIVQHESRLSNIRGFLDLGSGTYVGSFFNIRAVGGRIIIGENVQIAQSVSIIAANHLIGGNDKGKASERLDEKRVGVTIGDHVWVGCNSVILPGVTIGANSIVGAGSVVTKSIPAGEIWAGNPATFIKKI